MKKSLLFIYPLLLVFQCLSLKAQDSLSKKEFKLKPISIIVPAAISSYGFITLNSKALKNFNHQIHDQVVPNDKSRKFRADDYLQYGPAELALALNIAGVKGRSQPWDAIMVYGGSNVMLTSLVMPLKKMTHQLRPDSSAYNSFPSGHTAEAFASAEFLRMEYKDVNPWIGVAGYAMAFTTGYLRMYNNRHWFSDVVTGACIGVISTKVSYWAWGKIKKKFCRNFKH